MFRWWRLRRIRARFLESCRNLKEGRTYWSQTNGLARLFLGAIAPMPVLGLDPDGQLIYDALEWLESNCRSTRLSTDVIRQYHRMIFKDPPAAAGAYRTKPITMADNPLKPPTPQQLPALMKHLEIKVSALQDDFDAVHSPNPDYVLRAAVEVHYRIGVIHPFVNANGRVARLAMNHFLRRYGHGYVVYPSLEDSQKFWEILRHTRGDDFGEMVQFARSHVHRV